jgi:acyl-CoA thioesterase-1
MRIRFFFLVLLLAGGAGAATGPAAPTILVFGDSLSAAYGIPRESGWVNLLARRLENHKPAFRVVNASVSGETTAGGLTRLPQVLAAHRPILTILALGANDGLRGLPPPQTRRNLEAMIGLARKQGGQILLVGMRMPPNYGTAYTRKFQSVFVETAKAQRVRLVPFLLEGVAEHQAMFQADGLHPDARAQPALLDNVWRELAPMLAGLKDKAR